MSSLEQIKQLRIETKDEIDKIKDSDISDEDKKILISSHMKKFNDKFRKLNSNYDVKQFSSENNLVPSVNIFEQFNDLDIVGDFINKSFSEINSKVISNVNSNKIGAKSYNNMYSKSSSTSSFTDPEGVETVYKDKTENNNGKIKSKQSCYKINKNGSKTTIDCESKTEPFSSVPKNNYGKTIKINYV
jgi:hypothetical protein